MVVAELFKSGADIFWRAFRLPEVDRHQPVKGSAQYLRDVDCMQQVGGGLSVYKVTDFPYGGAPTSRINVSNSAIYTTRE